MTDLTHEEIEADLATHLPEGADPDIRWLIVKPQYPSSADTVRAYLYGHSVMVSVTNEGGGDICLVVVCGRAGRADADYLANYQADRLRSGLHTTWVFETYAQAYNKALALLTEV